MFVSAPPTVAVYPQLPTFAAYHRQPGHGDRTAWRRGSTPAVVPDDHGSPDRSGSTPCTCRPFPGAMLGLFLALDSRLVRSLIAIVLPRSRSALHCARSDCSHARIKAVACHPKPPAVSPQPADTLGATPSPPCRRAVAHLPGNAPPRIRRTVSTYCARFPSADHAPSIRAERERLSRLRSRWPTLGEHDHQQIRRFDKRAR